MIESFIPDGITLSNLREISQRQSKLCQMRLCEINELAYSASRSFCEMYGDDYGIYEILSYISDTLEGYELTPSDKVDFCKRLISIIFDSGLVISENHFLKSEHNGERIAYVKNTLSDEAYDVFSESLKSPRLLYTDTMNSAVASVVRGDSEYCILPFEEKGGVRVSTVTELIFKYDLKINTVTPVFGPAGNADMKYALIAKSFTIPKIESDDDRYLEIRLRADSSIPLSELLLAAESLCASIYRVNSVRFFEDNEDTEYYAIVFKALGGNFSELLIYLTLFSGAYTSVGIYKNLE